MDKYDENFYLFGASKIKAETLPKGWFWVKYNDGSGCLNSPNGTQYMEYDLNTNEYKVTKDSNYNFFPLSQYYIDGVSKSEFDPFEYMEKEITKILDILICNETKKTDYERN